MKHESQADYEHRLTGLQIKIPTEQHRALVEYKRSAGCSLSAAISTFLDLRKLREATKTRLLQNLKDLEDSP